MLLLLYWLKLFFDLLWRQTGVNGAEFAHREQPHRRAHDGKEREDDDHDNRCDRPFVFTETVVNLAVDLHARGLFAIAKTRPLDHLHDMKRPSRQPSVFPSPSSSCASSSSSLLLCSLRDCIVRRVQRSRPKRMGTGPKEQQEHSQRQPRPSRPRVRTRPGGRRPRCRGRR